MTDIGSNASDFVKGGELSVRHNSRCAKWLSLLAKESGPVWPTGQTWRERARSITAAQNATAERRFGVAGPALMRLLRFGRESTE